MSDVLSKCATCRHASWRQTANGRRHPDGSGECQYEVPDMVLPKWAHQWSWSHKEQLMTVRGLVSKHSVGRHIWYRESRLQECPTWEAK
jgi:hypothetical protein